MDLAATPWINRFPALPPRLAVARGPRASALALFLQNQPDSRLRKLRGACCTDFFFVMGESDYLPWIDGIQYLGVSPDAPGMYVPVNRRPGLDESIFCRVIKKRFLQEAELLGLVIEPLVVFSLAAAAELSRQCLPGIIRLIQGSEL